MGRREFREGIAASGPEPGGGCGQQDQDQKEKAGHLYHRLRVTALTVAGREGDLAVTGAAVAAGKEIDHRVAVRPFFDTDKDVGMTRLAPSPEGMFFVGEDDFRHPFGLCRQIEVLPGGDGLAFDRNFFEGIDEFMLSGELGLLPVDAVTEALLGEIGTERAEFILFLTRCRRGVTEGARFCQRLLIAAAGGEERFAGKDKGAVMAAAAVAPPFVIGGRDLGLADIHAETEIDVAETAGKILPMIPVIKADALDAGCGTGGRHDDVAVEVGADLFLADPTSSVGSAVNHSEGEGEQDQKRL